MELRLKNNSGILQIEAKDPVVSEVVRKSINQVADACLVCSNAELRDGKDQPIVYDGKPYFFENQDIHFTFVPLENQSNEFSLSIRGVEQFQSKIIKEQSILAGTIRYSNSAGYSDITVRDKSLGKDIINLKTEIYPQKIDYKKDFNLMLHEVTEIIYGLAFDYFKRTYLRTTDIDTSNQTLSQWLVILKHLFDSLVRHIDLVLKNIHYKIDISRVVKEISSVRKLDKKAEKWILKNNKFINKIGSGHKIRENIYTTHLPECKKILCYDTFENQFLVWAIRQIIFKINEILNHVEKMYLVNSKEIQNEISLLRRYKARLLGRLSDQYLRDVSDFDSQFHFSTVLTMAPGYKDFYKSFLLLKRGLNISAKHLFELDLKDISLLYEYWCFLKIIKILRDSDKYDLENNDFIKIEHDRFVIGLQKGKKSKVAFTKRNTQEEISLFYNKEFSASDYVTFTQKPDNFIEFKKEGYQSPFWYILDAKYRFDNGNQPGYPETKIPNGPPQDAIGQMHRYRDAILQKQAANQAYASAIKSLGGIILFPFPGDEHSFKDHPFHKSIEKVNIGAIPLHPGRDNELFTKFLDDLFSKTPETIFETVIDYDKSEYNDFVDDIKAIVLIGHVPEKDSEERIKFHTTKRLYHTRFDKKYDIETTNKNIFKAKYVALYSKKDKKIIGYAKVEEIDYVSSKELISKGVNWNLSRNEYLLFSLSEIVPCKLKFSGMTPQGKFYTNLFCFNQYLNNSVEEDFLKFVNFESIRLWKEVKNLDPICRFTKTDQILSFTYGNQEWECIQDKNNKQLFYINGRPYSFLQNLKEFLLERVV